MRKLGWGFGWLGLFALVTFLWLRWPPMAAPTEPAVQPASPTQPSRSASNTTETLEAARLSSDDASPQRLHPDPGASPPPDSGNASTEASETFAVQVLDAGGRPAAKVPVDVLRAKWLGGTSALLSGQSDSQGRVEFPLHPFSEQSHGPTSFAIAANLPHKDPIRLDLAQVPQAGETYTLTLPPMGSVLIEVLTPDGETFTAGPARVWTRWIPAGQVGRKTYGGYERCPDSERVTTNGITRYDYVGLGVVLTPSVAYRGYRNHSVADVPGPSHAGEEVRIQVPLGAAVPFLQARLLDPQGQPLTQSSVKGQVEYWNESSSSWRSEVYLREETDAEGVFSFPMTGRLSASEARRLVVEPEVGCHDARRSALTETRATLPFPTTVRAAPSELPLHLGDLPLQVPPLWVAGQITDAAGQPIRKVRIDASTPAPPHRSWPWQYATRTTSDESGRFAIRAFDPPEALRLTWVHTDFEGEPIEWTSIGESNLQVVLQAKATASDPQPERASLAIEFQCGASIDPRFVYLTVEPQRGEVATLPLQFLGTGETVLPNLPPGNLTLRVGLTGFERDSLVFDNLVLRAGETLRDPRLLPLDLRGLGRSAQWTLLLPGDQPLREGKVRVRLPGAQEHWKATTDLDGRLLLVLPTWVDRVELNAGADLWTPAVVGTDQVVRFPAVR